MARGRFVAFLDSDDLWLPEKLARHVAFMERTGHAASQTQETWLRRGRRVNPRRVHLKKDGDFFQSALALCLVSPSCVMIRKEFLDLVGGFDEKYSCRLRGLRPVAAHAASRSTIGLWTRN
jgi:glycosyltransferase involved in cell wall biosynthesis